MWKSSSPSYLQKQMLSREILVDMVSAVSNPYTTAMFHKCLHCTVHWWNKTGGENIFWFNFWITSSSDFKMHFSTCVNFSSWKKILLTANPPLKKKNTNTEQAWKKKPSVCGLNGFHSRNEMTNLSERTPSCGANVCWIWIVTCRINKALS